METDSYEIIIHDISTIYFADTLIDIHICKKLAQTSLLRIWYVANMICKYCSVTDKNRKHFWSAILSCGMIAVAKWFHI